MFEIERCSKWCIFYFWKKLNNFIFYFLTRLWISFHTNIFTWYIVSFGNSIPIMIWWLVKKIYPDTQMEVCCLKSPFGWLIYVHIWWNSGIPATNFQKSEPFLSPPLNLHFSSLLFFSENSNYFDVRVQIHICQFSLQIIHFFHNYFIYSCFFTNDRSIVFWVCH